MRSCNALLRALLMLGVGLMCLTAFGTRANADDPLPRAVPAARGFERVFSSYDAVIAYATAIAQVQSAVDGDMAALQSAKSVVIDSVGVITPTMSRGGALFDPDGRRDGLSELAFLRSQQRILDSAEQQQVAAGALTSAATPWQMPTEGRITQPFGPTSLRLEPSRVYGGVSYAHFHEGVDLAGAWAAPVVAPARGRVVFVGQMADGAEIVVLAHDGGLVTMYAHLDNSASPPPVKAGDEVAAGQRIGTVGLTGITTGQHLHWAAWRNGELIDPMTLIGKSSSPSGAAAPAKPSSAPVPPLPAHTKP